MQAPGEATEKLHSPQYQTGPSTDSGAEDSVSPVWIVDRPQGLTRMTRTTSRQECIS